MMNDTTRNGGLVLSMTALLCACASHRPSDERMSYTGQRLYPVPSADVPAPTAGYSKEGGSRQGRVAPAPYVQASTGTDEVRSNEVVHAYGVGRYVDPGDCRVMHERHAVYRLEEHSGWKLQAAPNRPVVIGPIVGLRRPEYAPEPLRGEVTRDLATTKAKVDATANGVQAVVSDQVAMRKQLQENAQRVNANQQYIEGQIGELNQRLSRMQNERPNPAAPAASAAPQPSSSASPSLLPTP